MTVKNYAQAGTKVLWSCLILIFLSHGQTSYQRLQRLQHFCETFLSSLDFFISFLLIFL